MGLSAEPVVEGLLVPKIKQLMESSIWASWPKHVPTRKHDVLSWAAYCGRIVFSLWINALGLIPLTQKGIAVVRHYCIAVVLLLLLCCSCCYASVGMLATVHLLATRCSLIYLSSTVWTVQVLVGRLHVFVSVTALVFATYLVSFTHPLCFVHLMCFSHLCLSASWCLLVTLCLLLTLSL